MKKPEVIFLPKICDDRGNLTFFQNNDQIPFEIGSLLWNYDIPSGQIKSGRSHNKSSEVIIALTGSFEIVVTFLDGTCEVFSLNAPNYGLYIPFNNWRHLQNFSTNAVSLHILDIRNSEEDLIANFDDFKKFNATSFNDN